MTPMVATAMVGLPQVPHWMALVLIAVSVIPVALGAIVTFKEPRQSRLMIATLAAVGMAAVGLWLTPHRVYATLWIPCDITCWIEALIW